MTGQSIDYMSWLVENRSENQKTTLKLLSIVRANRDLVTSDFEFRMLSGTLASVCFSLWRAVFLGGFGSLADSSVDDPVTKSIEDFLENLVMTNNVVFSTDLKYNEWSFRYYMFNAQLTLNWLKDNDSNLNIVDKHLTPDVDATNYWRSAHDSLVHAVDVLEKLIVNRREEKASSTTSIDNPLMK